MNVVENPFGFVTKMPVTTAPTKICWKLQMFVFFNRSLWPLFELLIRMSFISHLLYHLNLAKSIHSIVIWLNFTLVQRVVAGFFMDVCLTLPLAQIIPHLK